MDDDDEAEGGEMEMAAEEEDDDEEDDSDGRLLLWFRAADSVGEEADGFSRDCDAALLLLPDLS